MFVSFAPEITYELDMSSEDDRVTHELEEALIQDYYDNPGSHGLVRCPGPGRGRLMSEEERDVVRKLNSFGDHCMDQDSVGEWVQDLSPIKEIADAIWGLEESLEKHEMWLCAGEEMDQFTKDCDEKEALLVAQARSAPVGGEYLVPRYITADEFQDKARAVAMTYRQYDVPTTWEDRAEEKACESNPFIGMVWLPEFRQPFLPPGVMTPSSQLDAGDRMVVEATITRNGHKFHSAECDKGSIYIDLKYSSHIPEVGGKVAMIVRLKDVTKAKRWMCVKVLK
jgi:hypothetical protein